MPVNRNALIRYKTIDACLRNRRRRWTLADLIEKVSDTLYDYEGMEKGISRRTIQADIQMMRSDKLGYNAPIIIVEKKYYMYEDPDYSITNIPLSDADLTRMTEAVEVLKQFKGFTHFEHLNGVVQKLEGHVYASGHDKQTIIDFEKNENLKGLEHLNTIYEAIVNGMVLEISYQSFKALEPTPLDLHGWWLKEFKNRWFVVGAKGRNEEPTTLALDRIVAVKANKEKLYYPNESDYTPQTYYQHVIGPTVMKLRPNRVRIAVTGEHVPYVATKPLHPSQRIIEMAQDRMIIELLVITNLELEREILGFGNGMEVLEPARLRNRIAEKTRKAADLYSTE
ncbi:Predicted DNA-binding transcriptional regulator YafY, contains an HTH and WYL domains [Chitinophaga jiangningensis]|uniref:Predicted DNA-binding transcriptional regulator YafY, contains an HTH and WYL domains n=1 Tax=Chitinophaga jiangningensis TaxID=1419482 RepID=A0A1M7CIA7_9BACT|nr:WYL domain-containing protein [Chitinophaga jiangningensis]SHL67022.1 Predicted DNA-binding transcriptional regulator YafY, contains an HTH and WYL domains [Chitinophaga jiangningensis]